MPNYAEAIERKLEALRISEEAKASGYEDNAWKRGFGTFERISLRKAQSYWWAPDITEAIAESALSLPEDTALSFHRFRSYEAGWWWFDQPIRSYAKYGLEEFSAICWFVQSPRQDGTRQIILTTYGASRGTLCAQDTVFFDEHKTIGQLQARIDDDRDRVIDRLTDDPDHPLNGLSEAVESAKVESQGPLIRLFVAATLWIEQTIVTPHKETPERHARKRIERQAADDFDKSLFVVRLRRSESSHNESHGTEREWTCRWVVRGHWRQQYYPSRGERSPIWITPYVKGPDDKPIKVHGDTVFAVNR